MPAVVRTMSITTPNARCPVCGASVFFHQSPFGGRVFFDELGPPWPKHPCTDHQTPSVRSERAPVGAAQATPKWEREGWRPVRPQAIAKENGWSRFRFGDGDIPSLMIAGTVRCIASDPIFVRRSPLGDGAWELSYLPINAGQNSGSPDTFPALPTVRWQDYMQWQKARSGDPGARNLVGMAVSFARGKKTDDGVWTFSEPVDWAAAGLNFLMAAAAGYWAGFHNLATMYRYGFGVRQDPDLSFHLMVRAAELVPTGESDASIAALFDMIDLGWGTNEDEEDALSILDEWTRPPAL